jgi:hypothetical protein
LYIWEGEVKKWGLRCQGGGAGGAGGAPRGRLGGRLGGGGGRQHVTASAPSDGGRKSSGSWNVEKEAGATLVVPHPDSPAMLPHLADT